MDRQKIQQNQCLLPQNNHKNRRKIRHNHTRRPKHKRNVSKSSLQSKITKNSMEKIYRNAQIQSRNIRKNTKTNQQMVPIKQNMQQLWILQQRPKI